MKTLPADVHDALELSALAFGGIGAGWYGDDKAPHAWMNSPLCVMGHAWFLDQSGNNEVSGALMNAGIGAQESDLAVQRVNERAGRASGRIPFADWCKELDVVRGE